MTKTFEIKSRYDDSVVVYSGDGESLRDVMIEAVKNGANLRGANLSGADLRSADLRGANLIGAYLSGKKLVGERPLLQIGPIGSRSDYLLAFLTDGGVMIRAGCFFDSLEKFADAVENEHESNVHGNEYRAAIALIRIHAAAWVPAEASTETVAEQL